MQASTVRPANADLSNAPSLAGRSDFIIGLIVTALVPAVFWILTFVGLAALAGYATDPTALTIAGLAIAGFLGTFFAILTARPH